MPYFQQMYHAALTLNATEFNRLLDEGACIDEREKSEEFNTVAGKLAREGHIIQAKWLINRFGAAVEFVIHGMHIRGCAESVIKELTVQCAPLRASSAYIKLISEMTFGQSSGAYRQLRALYIAGHVEQAKQLFKAHKGKIKNWNRNEEDYLSYGGHIYYLEKTVKKLSSAAIYYLTGYCYESELGEQTRRFTTPELAVHTLSFIRNEGFLTYLIREFKREKGYPIDFTEVAMQARQIRALMTGFGLDYPHALACSQNPNLRPMEEKAKQLHEMKLDRLQIAYQMDREHAELFLKHPAIITWLKSLTHEVELSNKELQNIPPEIVRMIDDFILGQEKSESIRTNVQTVKLTGVTCNYSSRLFKEAPVQRSNPQPDAPRMARRPT